MFLKEFITINEAGTIEPVVNLDMMNDPAKNLELCKGFVFNYNRDRPKESTVGLLEVLRCSFQSPNEPNIHCVVQDYGKGKTHFALAIANFFSKALDSEEVTGIFKNINFATGEKGRAILANLESCKRHGRHLVFCLRGDKGGDLRKHFLKVAIDTLNKEGIANSIAHHLCQRPLEYLEQLDDGKKVQANRYLKQIKASEGDLESICELLRQNNYEVIPRVIDVANEITNGFAPDFTTNINIEDILADLVKNLCTGSNATFQGILILFDELNYYLDSWLTDKHHAGNTAPQNLTNACANHKAKIALMSFTQVDPNSKSTREGYQQISTRLAPANATYSPVSSLERVIDNVIVQQGNSAWQAFRKKWDDTLWATSQRIYKRAKKYQDGQNLSLQDFHKHLGLGCFPLHPLAGYLLCNLEFTQGRTAIEFVKKEVGEFLQNEVEGDRQLNYLYATALVDALAPNFRASKAKEVIYETYCRALEAITVEANPDEIAVLKAIFLYAASGDMLAKVTNYESHDEILVDLTGLSKTRLTKALERLCNDRQVTYRRPDGIYQFFTGTNPRELEQRVIAELEEESKHKQNPPALEKVFAEYCRENITQVFGEEVTRPTQFASENRLIALDWSFENQVFTIAEFEKFLQKPQEIQKVRTKGYQGIIAHVIDNNAKELDELWEEIDSLLQKSSLSQRLVVAIAKQDLGDDEENLGRILQKINILKTKFVSDRTAAYTNLLNDWEKQLRDRTHTLFQPANLRCHSALGHKISAQERRYPNSHASALLQDLYFQVPSIGAIDKLERKHQTGDKCAVILAKQLFINQGKVPSASLETKYQTTIEAFVTHWQMFKKTSGFYILQEPVNSKVRDAWDKISELCQIKNDRILEIELVKLWQELSEPPYGYHESIFTVLLAGWLTFHRGEIALRGAIALIPSSKKRKSDPLQPVLTKSLEEWAATNILEKADTFVNEWIIKFDAKLIRRQRLTPPVPPTLPTDYDQAIAYLNQAQTFLEDNSNTPEAYTVKEWQTRLSKSVKEFERWYEPIKQAEVLTLDTPMENLVRIYPKVLEDCRVTDIEKTASQAEIQHQALRRLQQLIDERVKQLQLEPESLHSIQECVSHLSNVEAAITWLKSVADLPEQHIQKLNTTKIAIAQRQSQIQTRELITQKLREVQSRYDGLSKLATQAEYAEAITAIEQIANELPTLRTEEKYQAILENISDRQEELKQQIELWGSLYISESLSKSDANDLRDEIKKETSRYTNPSDRERLQVMADYLKQKILDIEQADGLEKTNERVIEQAQQGLQSIREAKSLSAMFDSYKRIYSLQLRTGTNLDLTTQQNQLTQLKSGSCDTLIEKLRQTISKYDTEINKQEEYTQRQALLQQAQTLLPLEPQFAEIRSQIEMISTTLEERFEAFKKKLIDGRTLQEIRRLAPTASSTIRNCEENIREIDHLSQQLNDAESYTAEINQRIADFQAQINRYCDDLNRLQTRLDAIASDKELGQFKTDYAKLDLIFKDSSHYPAYQQIQAGVDVLDEELDKIRDLESLKLQIGSIVICERSRQHLATESSKIAERFQPQVQVIDKYLCDRIDIYRHELEDLSLRLTTATGLKAIQNLQAELTRKSDYYLGSEADESHYTQLRDRISRLQTLYQLVDTARQKNLDDYDKQLQELQQWFDEDSQIPEWMTERYTKVRRETEQNRHALLAKYRQEAREWLNKLDLDLQVIAADSEPDRQGKKASELINRIRTEKSEYSNGLTEELEARLIAIAQECTTIHERDLESQILLRFRQLPQSRRASVYERMQQYLTDTTEEL